MMLPGIARNCPELPGIKTGNFVICMKIFEKADKKRK